MSTQEKKVRTFEEMEHLLVKHDNFCVIDLETSGFSPNKGGRIIEIGAIKVINGVVSSTFGTLINPELKVSKKITEVTGITNKMLENEPTYAEVLPKLHQFIGDSVVVCHNVGFDWDRFLLHYFKQVGLFPKNEVIDTLTLAKKYLPGKKSYKLSVLCEDMGISLEGAHRAVNDAEVTAKVILQFKELYANQLSMFEAVPKQPDATLPKQVNNIKVRRVSKWEKNDGKRTYKRLYISMNIGTIFFDVLTNSWQVKNLECDSFNMEQAKAEVLKFLKLENEQQLSHYYKEAV